MIFKRYFVLINIFCLLLNMNSYSLDIKYVSKVSSLDISREYLFNLANKDFIELDLKNAFSDKKLQRKVFDYCKEKDLKYTDVLINAYKESNMRSNALNYNDNGTCDVGIMQINIPISELNIDHLLFNPLINVENGAYMMRQIIDRYDANNLIEILIAYQYGYNRLYDYKNNSFEPKEYWYKKIEEAENYIEKAIRRVIFKQIDNGERIVISNKKSYHTHVPKDFFENY